MKTCTDDLPIDFEKLACAAFDAFLLELELPVVYQCRDDGSIGPWHKLDAKLRAAWMVAVSEGASHAGRRIAFGRQRELLAEVGALRAERDSLLLDVAELRRDVERLRREVEARPEISVEDAALHDEGLTMPIDLMRDERVRAAWDRIDEALRAHAQKAGE